MLNRSIFLLLFVVPVSVIAQHRHHDSHEHGAGTMNIALDGEVLTIELEIPGNDIVGFEHAAKSESDKAKIETAIKILNEVPKMFSFLPTSSCVVKGAPKISFVAEGEDEDDSRSHHGMHHDEEEEATESHTELKAEYSFNCKEVNGVKFEAFSNFPSIKELDAQVAFGNVQVSYELSPKEPIAYLEDRD